jgi:selenoprotein W-related protein
LASEILTKYGTKVRELTLIPSSGGVFEIKQENRLIFSKDQTGRFPENGEIFDLIS